MQCLNGAFIFLIFNFAALFGSGQFKRTSRIDEIERGWDKIVAGLSSSQIFFVCHHVAGSSSLLLACWSSTSPSLPWPLAIIGAVYSDLKNRLMGRHPADDARRSTSGRAGLFAD